MEVIITGEVIRVYGYHRKWKVILCSGSSTSLQDRRQRARCVPKWQSRWFYFLTWKGLFTKNMSSRVKEWINITIEVLKRMRMTVCRKMPKKWESGAWVLHHDNAPTHTAQSVQVLFSKPWHSCGSATITPLSWILATSGCFPNLKWH
jgi:hypothetical protein